MLLLLKLHALSIFNGLHPSTTHIYEDNFSQPGVLFISKILCLKGLSKK